MVTGRLRELARGGVKTPSEGKRGAGNREQKEQLSFGPSNHREKRSGKANKGSRLARELGGEV